MTIRRSAFAPSPELMKRLSLIAAAARQGGLSAAAALMWRGLRRRFGFAVAEPPAFGEDPLIAWLDAATAADESGPGALDAFASAVRDAAAAAAPRISVVIPCYNYGAYVEEAVASLEAQCLRPLEIVLVDDGSTDAHTVDVCTKLGETRRVRLLRQGNRGLSAARNAGAAATVGDFLLFLDADDILDPLALAVLWYALSRHPEAAYAYPYQRFFGDADFVVASQDFNGYDLLFANHPCVAALIRRPAFTDSGGYRSEMRYGFEDWEHWLALMESGHEGMAVPIPVFRHRRHGPTMTQAAHERRRYLLERLIELHPELYRPQAMCARRRKWRPLLSILTNRSPTESGAPGLSRDTCGDHEWIDVGADWWPAAARAHGEFVVAIDEASQIQGSALETMVLAGLLQPAKPIISLRLPGDKRPPPPMFRRDTLLAVDRACGPPPCSAAEWSRLACEHMLRYRGAGTRYDATANCGAPPLDPLLLAGAVAWRHERASGVQYHRYRRDPTPDLFSPAVWDPMGARHVLILADRWDRESRSAVDRWIKAGFKPTVAVLSLSSPTAAPPCETFWLSALSRDASARGKLLRYLVISRAVAVIEMDPASSCATTVARLAARLPYLLVRTPNAAPPPAATVTAWEPMRRTALLDVLDEPVL